MSYQMIVLVKQVPDTQNITAQAMKEDGTVNRSALPAIYNPEDLNALEEALKIKEKYGGKITVITMGPPNAAEVLRQSLYRGADEVVLLSDRKFAGADTLATSYVLAKAIKKTGDFDLIFCGRQAIDGDTAQVGPQTAEKLKINQITFVDKILSIKDKELTVERSIEGGYEVVKSSFPLLLTITDESNIPRPPAVKKVLTYKNAVSPLELDNYDDEYLSNQNNNPSNLKIQHWTHESIDAKTVQCGLSGSPTKVKKIESVILEAPEIKNIANSDEGIKTLLKELTDEHIIG
ncbi:MAG: electron transfer flavoprotein subunit beta/FixA family protein [Spirochaetes bacterium]|nr:electron transfer flavoprotein subunit beta/FixA family protein [Spirochaetota bacterium]